METIKLKRLPDGTYVTDPFITKDEWLSVLREAEKTGRDQQIGTLLMFLRSPQSKRTCTDIGKEYGMSYKAVNNIVVNFGRFSQKFLGNKFRIEREENKEDVFWAIPMLEKDLGKGRFEWTLRPELVAALRTLLIERMIAEYRGPVIKEGLDNSRSKELYKWRLLSSAKDKGIPEMLAVMTSQEMNILNWRTKDSIKDALKAFPSQIEDCFSKLITTDGDFYQKFNAFVAAGKQFLPKTDAERILKEKEAAFFLACINPKENAIYKWTLYKTAASYLGIEVDNKRPYDAFVEILNAIIAIENKDSELIDKLKAETRGFIWSDFLNAQDVLWQTQEFMKTSQSKNWLQQLYDSALSSGNWMFTNWFPQYVDSVTRFRAIFQDGRTAADADRETLEFFIRTPNNGISSNKHKSYTKAEFESILGIWPELFDIFKRCIKSDSIPKEEYNAVWSLIEPIQEQNRYAAFHRLWAGLFPDLLTSVIADDRFNSVYKRIKEIDSSLPDSTGTWLGDNFNLMQYFKEKVSFKESWHRAIFAWFLYETPFKIDNTQDMNKYIQLLKSNKNLILTGAPGTGKTYLAKKIAKEMGDDNPGFVQFHPSYDYTDFVEGLRPNDSGSFERVNGVFKQFCSDALHTNSAVNFDEAYGKLINDLSTYSSPMVIQSGIVSSASFGILVNSKGSLDLYNISTDLGTDAPLNDSPVEYPGFKKNGSLTKERIRDWEQQFYWKGYYKGVYQLLIDKYGLVEGENTTPVPRVFIIDEINRGELSKIFGELFFAIEPGYRGTNGRVKTQYQNLVEPGDPFEKGFYVPENVYVIGTMNDIDRGVESMDFAIRRRFAWKEVKVEDRIEMLDEEIRGSGSGAVDSQLFSILKDLRRKVAKQYGLPTYVIFQEPSLDAMATTYPITIEELQNIPGVGPGKAKRYGQEIIEIIKK